jgi:tetratricopeptide (TPR) repeat protein
MNSFPFFSAWLSANLLAAFSAAGVTPALAQQGGVTQAPPVLTPHSSLLVRPVDARWASLRQAIEDEAYSAHALDHLKDAAVGTSASGPGSRPRTIKVFPAAQAQGMPDELRRAADRFAAQAPAIELKPALRRLYIEGERNAVLNYQRLALAAMSVGQWELAEKALDQALLRIDAFYANNEQAEKARSVFTLEQAKDFKGEPYERAMAYYYRGLLYVARADYQNARAMFMQAEYQDTVSELEKFAGDFGAMSLLAAWASACDGNTSLAREFRERALKTDASLASVDLRLRNLVIYEAGRVPYKLNVGSHGQGLAWMGHRVAAQTPVQPACETAGTFEAVAPTVERQAARGATTKKAAPAADSRPASVAPVCTTPWAKAGDLGFQATTRGGRTVDAILQGKAAFKDNAQGIADAAQQVSTMALLTSAQTGNQNMAGLGLAGLLVGMAAQAASSNTQAQADIREWEQLPLDIWVAQMPGSISAQALVMGERRLVRLGDGRACQLFWGREHPGTKRFYEAGPLEPSTAPRDEVFRTSLTAQF